MNKVVCGYLWLHGLAAGSSIRLQPLAPTDVHVSSMHIDFWLAERETPTISRISEQVRNLVYWCAIQCKVDKNRLYEASLLLNLVQ